MENGDLRAYLGRNCPPKTLQFSWFRQMARGLACIHDRSVIVADIASRNFLLDSDLSVKFCDFTESSVMPLHTNMETADDNGYSIQTDMGQLGAVIYEVVTGERCRFDVFKDQPPEATRATWPRRESLPNTRNLWLGSIIEKCWTKGAFQNANCLLKALEAISLGDGKSTRGHEVHEEDTQEKKQFLFPLRMGNIPMEPLIAFVITVGVITSLTAWIRRRS